ncbi:MAG: UvrD-helicase domain-containing protein [Congregibacter sp.]
MNDPIDRQARERALSPELSCCVSAPAGSGKTSLLVQRFLLLLQRVEHPESVVAMTFTRKAAAEMRARVLELLQDAAAGKQPRDAYEAAQLALAQRVLARDEALDWNLVGHSGRLQIQTIDSYCGELTRQMPLRSGSGGQLTPSDDSAPLYAQTTSEFLDRVLGSASHPLAEDARNLLLHLDNNWAAVSELLAGLLQKREQWQRLLGARGLDGHSRDWLRDSLRVMLEERISRLNQYFAPWMDQLLRATAYSRENLYGRADCDVDGPEFWRHVGGMLLTKQGDWRSRLTVKEGFPAGKGPQAESKADATALLEALRDCMTDDLRRALQQLALIPDADGESENWEVLASVTRLLPSLSAELLLVFQQRGEVDHSQIALAALNALGDDESPTDVAMRLDYRLEHLLVDEFQDTSSLQFELVRRLTRGWREHNETNPDAPRTLFLVGDPMQSIYGFREANVGLFIKARKFGVGDLPLEVLYLRMNFRSGVRIVDWVNTHFEQAFPKDDDVSSGAVSYQPAVAVRESGVDPVLDLYTGEDAHLAEAKAVCDRLEQGLENPAVQSIAVLGRSRSQLQPLIAEMRLRGIPAVANDLDALDQRGIIRDLITMCELILDEYDRYAWLSLLRTPAFALDHADLLLVAQHFPTAASLRESLFAEKEAGRFLSSVGCERLERALEWLSWLDRYRGRLATRVLFEESWLRLAGAAMLDDEVAARDVEQFFSAVQALEQSGQRIDKNRLRKAVSGLYASSGSRDCKIQIMTLHKAKGLEFDWVFIPALGRSTRGSDQELLRWEELALEERGTGFLLDVKPARAAAPGPRLYDYLGDHLKQKAEFEAVRLFYVGCTRAVNALYLSAALSEDEASGEPKSPSRGSLLASIWPSVWPQGEVRTQAVSTVAEVTRTDIEAASVTQVPAARYWRVKGLPVIEARTGSATDSAPTLEDPSELPRTLGTAIHRCLEALLYRAELPQQIDEQLENTLRASLLNLGIPVPELSALQERGMKMLNSVLQDPWFRWSQSDTQRSRAAELPITTLVDGEPQALVIDYTFVDADSGERWIVDYKTAAPREGDSMETFFAQQEAHYYDQLQRYREACEACYGESSRCVLYFTALAKHHEVRIETR